MAKKLTNVYMNQKDEPGGRKILMDTEETPKEKPQTPKIKMQGGGKWGFFRPIVISVISLVLMGGLIAYGYDYLTNRYFAPVDTGDNTPIEVTIPKAASLTTIAQILFDNNVIRDKNVFKLYTDFSDMSYKLKAGTYALSKNMTFDDIIYTLMKGEPASPVTDITLTEGMTLETMAQTLVDKGIYKNDSKFLSLCKDGTDFSNYPFIADLIGKEDGRVYILEGYLFPDTYQIYTDSSEEVVIRKFLDRFDQIFTNDYISKADEMGFTIDQVITIASIIEKEGKPKDYKKISAVLHNRLVLEMPLQVDATLQYATGLKKLTFTDAEKDIDSPYNTYKYKGLPVGPICNPGKNAIEAVLFPDEQFVEEGYLYFSLTTPESGDLVFAKTLEEHNANVDKWSPFWTTTQ